ncbi:MULTISPECIES: DUF5677 domain-containing protein [Pseudomonas]|uniref:DUF5677 domain-containing protein n=1 Tax=Pseudomonas TaxID=286 RepID=UPI0018D7B0EA|nr:MULTISPECIES: DUF5677 domain-containing protein [Pseudomonas]MBH3371911.1 helix-turn-helix transcriptional regulator [Pseudomonas juntendi]MBS6039263.1 helix-turn-helix transcriptional regulator [Pseudomonas sp.]
MDGSSLYTRDKDVETQFEAMLGLMADMITAQGGIPEPEPNPPQWSVDLHVLSMKLFKHLGSARTLLEPCPFRTATHSPYGYIDHSSIATVTRAALENYLVMHWLFCEKDANKREYNHNLWMYGGLKKRSKFIATTAEAETAKELAAIQADKLLSLITASPFYQSYDNGQKKNVRKGLWDVEWYLRDLASDAGIHIVYFSSIYQHMSGYVHSDYISCLQIGQAERLTDQYMLGSASISTCLMILGHFAIFYARMFPTAKSVLEASSVKSLVEKWHIRTEDMDFLYVQDHSDI